MNSWRRILDAALCPSTPRQARLVDGALLALLLAITLLRGLTWAGAYPALKITDEPAHFDNIQYRAEHGFHAPRPDGTHIEKVMNMGSSLELRHLWRATNHYWRGHFLPDKRRVPDELELEQMALVKQNRVTTGQSPSLSYPGFYYSLGVPWYRAFRGSSVLNRVYALRVYSILWGLVLVGCTFIAARLTLTSRSLAFVAALFVCMQPMAAQQMSAVNNDAGVIGLGAAVFLLQLVILQRLPQPPSIAALVGLALLSALAIETKPHAYALVPGSLLICAAVFWTAPRARTTWLALSLGALTFLVVRGLCHLICDSVAPGSVAAAGAVQAAATATQPLQNAVELPSMGFFGFLDAIEPSFFEYLFMTAWGTFCWLDISLSADWFEALKLTSYLFWIGVTVATTSVLLLPDVRRFWDRRLGIFAAFTAFTGFLTILYAEYTLRIPGNVNHIVQGRSLLIVLPAFALVGAIALGSLVPRRLRPLATLIAACMILMLAFGSLVTVVNYDYVG